MVGLRARFDGVSKEVMEILEADMDEAPARSRAREAFKDFQLSIDHYLFKLPADGVKTNESYELNSKGFKIFTKSWLPVASSPKALIFYCHGYGDTCTFFGEGIARKLVSSGYGVLSMDYPGFGLSEGLHGYIPSFDILADEVIDQYSKLKENLEFSTLPIFMFGQSMGGAVALKVHLKQPNTWDGAILVAPMCKEILIGVAKLFPKAKLVPQKDLAEAAFRDLKYRQLTAYNIVAYKDKPRLRTAVEMLNTTQEIERRLDEVSLPLLILHGEDDIVTDPSVNNALYEKASSSDKNLNLYKDVYHSLLEGEPDEMIDRVFIDIIAWLDQRCVKPRIC